MNGHIKNKHNGKVPSGTIGGYANAMVKKFIKNKKNINNIYNIPPQPKRFKTNHY